LEFEGIAGIIGQASDRSSRVANVKSTAWKEAVAFFLSMLTVAVCWNLIAKTRDSAIQTLGVPALAAIFFYVYKRKDWFD
jgi:hypothetical protein